MSKKMLAAGIHEYHPKQTHSIVKLVFQGGLHNFSQVFFSVGSNNISNSWSQVKNASLRQCSLDQLFNVACLVAGESVKYNLPFRLFKNSPDSLQTTRNTQGIQEAGNGFIQMGTELPVWDSSNGRVGDRGGIEDGQGLTMTFR